jgi:prepilin-type N-terminal cleavage/methylation domain-containing protein
MVTTAQKRLQSGFTLIELIIVIVVIGILAAVAIPQFTNVSTEATHAKNTAILGAVKSAWGVALITSKPNNPTTAEIAAVMADPVCTAPTTASISCATSATTTLIFAATLASGKVASPADITCNPTTDCN